MAKRGHRRSSGGFGGLTRGNGMLPAPVKNIAAGWGAASIAEMFGFGGALIGGAAGYVVAGPMGLAGGAGKSLLKGVDFKGAGSQIASNAIG